MSLLVAQWPLLGGCKPADTPANEPAREPAPAAQPPPAQDPAPAAATKETSYLACGCGCCGGLDRGSAPRQCIDRKKGETLEQIKAQDEQQRSDPGCATRGCSRGTLYTYCE